MAERFIRANETQQNFRPGTKAVTRIFRTAPKGNRQKQTAPGQLFNQTSTPSLLTDKFLFFNSKTSTMADNQKGRTGQQDQGRNQGNSTNLGNSERTGNQSQQQNTSGSSSSQSSQPGMGRSADRSSSGNSSSSGNIGNRNR